MPDVTPLGVLTELWSFLLNLMSNRFGQTSGKMGIGRGWRHTPVVLQG